MIKILILVAVVGLTVACRTAEVVERAAENIASDPEAALPLGPPTVTPRPAFVYPTNAPTPTRDYDAISRRLSEAQGTVVPTRVRRSWITPTPDATCAELATIREGVHRRGHTDQDWYNLTIEAGMAPETMLELMAECDIDIDVTPQAAGAPPVRSTPTSFYCSRMTETIRGWRAKGINDQTSYEGLTDIDGFTGFTEEGMEYALWKLGECGIRMDAEPRPEHAHLEVFR